MFPGDLDSSESELEMDAIQDQDAPSSFSPISSSDEDSLFSDSDTEIDLSSDELTEDDFEHGMS